MLTKIHEAIQTLEHYKYSKFANEFSEKFPFESKRREAYINNLSYQLNLFLRNPIPTTLKFVIDEIQNTLTLNLFGIEQESQINYPTTDLYNRLHHTLKLIEDHYQTLLNCETVRNKVKQTFTELPTLISEFCRELSAKNQYLEDHFAIKANLNSQLYQREPNNFNTLLKVYSEVKNQTAIEYCKPLLFAPINLFFEPTRESLQQRSYLENELYFYQIIMNFAVYLYYFDRELAPFRTIQSITEIKNNIRSLCRIFHQIKLLFKEFMNNKNSYREKIVKLNMQGNMHFQGDMVNLLRLFDRVESKILGFSQILSKVQSGTAIIFAYVWDESINSFRERDTKSRLEKLLNNLSFDPLSDEDIDEASRKSALKLFSRFFLNQNDLSKIIRAVNN